MVSAFDYFSLFSNALTHSCVSLSGNSSELMIKIAGINKRIQGKSYQWCERISWRPVRENISYNHLPNYYMKMF